MKEEKKRREKEWGRAKAFKRLLVTKLMGSFIPCFCRSFTRSRYTLSLRTSFCSEWRRRRRREDEEKYTSFFQSLVKCFSFSKVVLVLPQIATALQHVTWNRKKRRERRGDCDDSKEKICLPPHSSLLEVCPFLNGCNWRSSSSSIHLINYLF